MSCSAPDNIADPAGAALLLLLGLIDGDTPSLGFILTDDAPGTDYSLLTSDDGSDGKITTTD